MKTQEKRYDWKEYPDPTPVEIPIEMQRPESMDEKIKRIIQTQISAQAAMNGTETFDEANDFDVQDDFEVAEPVSQHEMIDMMPEYPEGLEEKIKSETVQPEDQKLNPSSTDDSEPPKGVESSSTEPDNSLEQKPDEKTV